MVTGPVSIPGRYWETVERLKINQFYGAPTAIRLLLRYGDEWVKKYDRSSLKVLGSGNCWWHELAGAANPWASGCASSHECQEQQHVEAERGETAIWGQLCEQALGNCL